MRPIPLPPLWETDPHRGSTGKGTSYRSAPSEGLGRLNTKGREELRKCLDKCIAKIEGGVSERGGKHTNLIDRAAACRDARRKQFGVTRRIPTQRHRTLESSASPGSSLRDTDDLRTIDGDLSGGESSETHNGRQLVRHHCPAMHHAFTAH